MKLRNKLILSCAALAAVATTAVSSTFAWYTTNTKVTANNIVGATSNSGDELLLIADGQKNTSTTVGGVTTVTTNRLSGTDLKWGTQVANVTVTQTALSPLAYVKPGEGVTLTEGSAGVLQALTSDTSTKKDENPTLVAASTDGTGYVQFVLYLKNASTGAKALNFSLDSYTNNSASELPAKTVIGDNAKFIGLASTAPTYTVDMTRALCLDLEIWTSTDAGTNKTFLSENIYKFDAATNKVSIATDSLTGSAESTEAITVTPADDGSYSATKKFSAHQYRNSIMEQQVALTDPTDYASTQMSAAGAITGLVSKENFATAGTADTANTCLIVVGKVFLNGWDLACFDACQGQNFTFDISFTV
jgi:hypothetical protein